MAESVFASLRDYVEPAHPMIIKFHDDLITLYKYIRENYQQEIDATFDRVSRQIGYIVTATLPVVLEVGESGKIESLQVGAEHLKRTLFDQEFSQVLRRFADSSRPLGQQIAPGTYKLYFLWQGALKLKLSARYGSVVPQRRLGVNLHSGAQIKPVWDVMEPAHWFDPGSVIQFEEAVLISVIDEVYPELQLVQRIDEARVQAIGMGRAVGAVQEQALQSITKEQEILTELANVLRRGGY
jgi:hypothetical protein